MFVQSIAALATDVYVTFLILVKVLVPYPSQSILFHSICSGWDWTLRWMSRSCRTTPRFVRLVTLRPRFQSRLLELSRETSRFISGRVFGLEARQLSISFASFSNSLVEIPACARLLLILSSGNCVASVAIGSKRRVKRKKVPRMALIRTRLFLLKRS